MDPDRLVDVLTLLVRSNRLHGTERLSFFVAELFAKLAAEYERFPELRLMLELHHPADPFVRAATVGKEPVPLPAYDPTVRRFVERVLGMGGYRVAHVGGIVNPRPADFHLTMADHPFPVSISIEEMHQLLGMVRSLPPGPVRILEIGTGFGLSSHFLAAAGSERPGGCEVVTVDPFVEDRHTDHSSVEDEGYDQAAVDYEQNLSYRSFRALRAEFAELAVRQVLDYSPRCFSTPAVGGEPFDLVFIDGNHFGEQPTADFDGAVPVAKPDALFVLHDGHAPGVMRLLDRLTGRPWEVEPRATSCNLVTVRRRAAMMAAA